MGYIPLQKGVVYGPVKSKRLGRSLGVNLTPPGVKVCTFNCVYCFYGPTTTHRGEGFPEVDDVARALETALKKHPRVDYITFAGNGEPTLHPAFDAVVAAVRRVRDRHASGTPLALLSNATTLRRDAVVDALPFVDFAVLKLDAADERTFRRINRPVIPITAAEIVAALRELETPVIQSVMVCGSVDSHRGEALKAWTAAVESIGPRLVQIYTLDGPIESLGIGPCDWTRVREVRRLLLESGVPAETYRD